MVKRRVPAGFLQASHFAWIALAFACMPMHAAAQLALTLDKKVSTLGMPLQLRIASQSDLSTLDITPLQRDFEVFNSAFSTGTYRGKQHSALDITLYPLHSGKFRLPRLTLGAARTPALPLEIQAPNVALRAWLTPALPMEREPSTLHLEIRDDGSLLWSRPTQIDAPHSMLRDLPEQTHKETRTGSTVREYRWRVLPLKNGSLGIAFGMLDAYQFGQRLRFPVSAVSFRAQPAPAYLPLYLAIGKPLIHAGNLPRHIIVGQPVAWNMDIEAPGLSSAGVLQSLRIEAPRGLRLYPPSVTPVKRDGGDALRLTLSFVADQREARFPALRLAYFDPRTRRVEALAIPAATLTVRDPLREKIVASGLILFGLLLLAWIGHKTWPWLRRWRVKRLWLARIQTAHDPASLYRVLTQAAPWRAPTLQHWPDAWRIAPALRAQLEQLRFGPNADAAPFSDLKQAWHLACAQLPLHCFT